jgi:hypothetical protein
VRSERGEKVLQDAAAKGILDAERIDPKSFEPIEKAARSKAMRYYSLKPGQAAED